MENTKLTKIKSMSSKKKQYDKYKGSIKQERQNLNYSKKKRHSGKQSNRAKRVNKFDIGKENDPCPLLKGEVESSSESVSESSDTENIPLARLFKKRKLN